MKSLEKKQKKILRHINNKNFSVIDVTESNIKNFISYIAKKYSALEKTKTEYGGHKWCR